ATASSLRVIERRRAVEEKKADELKSQAEKDAETLNEKTVTIVARVGSSDRLYGSITSDDIAVAVQSSFGVTVDKRKIQMTDQIKSLGTYNIGLKLHRDITVPITVEVTKGA
ncbi:MAG: 50S ribosomal protein L9, partial [Akkermansiaceae bacterium]|nr:50S ribosomal protein L9 [Armatimonadota bacterium]